MHCQPLPSLGLCVHSLKWFLHEHSVHLSPALQKALECAGDPRRIDAPCAVHCLQKLTDAHFDELSAALIPLQHEYFGTLCGSDLREKLHLLRDR